MPLITGLLIIVNVSLFVYQVSLGPWIENFVVNYGLVPIELTRAENLPYSRLIPPYVGLVTSMFLHGGVWHLMGNMWFLWIFGDNVEDYLGHFTFLIFYLVTGSVGSLLHVAFHPLLTTPLIGASGAISGVLGAYAVLHPRARIKSLVPLGFFIQVVYIPAIFFLLVWFLMQILGGLGRPDSVAYGAHVGGFVAGCILILFFKFSRR